MQPKSKVPAPDPRKLLDIASERIKTAYQAEVSGKDSGRALSDTIEAVRLTIEALRQGDWGSPR